MICTLEKMVPTAGNSIAVAGTPQPPWASSTAVATARRKVDLPAMFGPVTTQTRIRSSRHRSLPMPPCAASRSAWHRPSTARREPGRGYVQPRSAVVAARLHMASTSPAASRIAARLALAASRATASKARQPRAPRRDARARSVVDLRRRERRREPRADGLQAGRIGGAETLAERYRRGERGQDARPAVADRGQVVLEPLCPPQAETGQRRLRRRQLPGRVEIAVRRASAPIASSRRP